MARIARKGTISRSIVLPSFQEVQLHLNEAKKAVEEEKKLVGNPKHPEPGSLHGILYSGRAPAAIFAELHAKIPIEKTDERELYKSVERAWAMTNWFIEKFFENYQYIGDIKDRVKKIKWNNNMILLWWDHLFKNDVYTRGDFENHLIVFKRSLGILWDLLDKLAKDIDSLLEDMPNIVRLSIEYFERIISSATQGMPVQQPPPGEKLPSPSDETQEIPRPGGKPVYIPVK